MKLNLSQQFLQEQRIFMTHSMHQAFFILQMPLIELKHWLEEEIEKNPILERIERKIPSIKDPSYIPQKSSFFTFIEKQICELFLEKTQRAIALKLFSFLDEKGYLTIDSCNEEELNILNILQENLEPAGVFARSLQESLLIQLKRKKHLWGYSLIKEDFEKLLSKDFLYLQKKYSLTKEALSLQIKKEIGSLSLYPSISYVTEPAPATLQPDLTLEKRDTSWLLLYKEEELLLFTVQRSYEKDMPALVKQAKWLIKALTYRKLLLTKIGRYLVEKQIAFFEGGSLVPLSIQEMADELNIHESTATRAIQGKSISTQRGLFALRFFFTSSIQSNSEKKISSHTAKELLKTLLQKEEGLSDSALVKRLYKQGISLSRRTVTKYRQTLKIPSSRKRLFSN